MIYPFSVELQEAAKNFPNGNFGLWFYKFVPLNERDFKACTLRSGEKDVVSFYQRQYDLLKTGAELRTMLDKRHKDQQRFCRLHEANGAKVIEIRAELCAPLITGIGKTHPNEVGMTFDHTMGIPYLPATGIKGVVRLGHILNLLADQDKAKIFIHDEVFFDDTHPDSMIPDIFGGDIKDGGSLSKYRGKAIFLDAYPEKIPDLHVDIMNPHYGDYYSDDSAQMPPADYLNPVPIQFLTIKMGVVFVFRAIVKEPTDLFEPLLRAYYTALTELGFGAKTAVGYGMFHIQDGGGTAPIKQDRQMSAAEAKPAAERKVWESVTLTYTPGNALITATGGMGTATAKGKELVPEAYHAKLFGKKKRATPRKVVVEAMGNAWRIVEIV